jgi:threonine/homoserine/homoserine lactone efflux protein
VDDHARGWRPAGLRTAHKNALCAYHPEWHSTECPEPKLTLFFLAFLPQFVPAATGSPTLAMLWLSAVFMLLTFLVFVGYGAFAAAARSQIISRPKVLLWFRGSFAATFGVLGLRLALSEK